METSSSGISCKEISESDEFAQKLWRGTLLSVMWQPGWEGSLGEWGDTPICTTEALCFPPELSQHS